MSHDTPNHAYRLVWSEVHQAFVAVAEGARQRGKRGTPPLLKLLLLSPLLATAAAHGGDLPAGAQISAGSGSIASRGSTLTVNQSSARLITDWQSFSIGAGHTVRFVQPSAQAVALNRVTGSDPSVIQGALRANGQVFLINPNGILFTPTAQVDVGGLVASTLALDSADFPAARYTLAGDGGHAVVNQGRITAASGGSIALVAAQVDNAGTLSATHGNVLLGAGSRVVLDLGGAVKIQVTQGAVDAQVRQGGAIRADGGRVYLTGQAAGELAATVINHTGVTEAQTLASGESGQIVLLGGMDSDRIVVGGRLDASAPHGGNGGFIETSAAKVELAADHRITTRAAQGRTGTWLIDPADYVIAASNGDITGAQLSSDLSNSSVVIESSRGAAGAGAHGDIQINDAVSWSANTLTLTAARDINLRAMMTASGSARLALNPGTANGSDGAVGDGAFKVGFNAGDATGFAGRIDFGGRSGAGLLSINDQPYVVISALGAPASVTAADLQGLRGDLAGFYALGSDIDASASAGWNGGLGFSPIGSAATPFTGQLEGLGHSIGHLTINDAASDNVGLFGKAVGAVLRNVGLSEAQITGRNQVGALLAEGVTGRLYNSFATGGHVTGQQQVGGLLGANNTVRVNDSHSSNAVDGADQVGGLIGWANGGVDASDNYASGDVVASGSNVGGLIGYNDFAFNVLTSRASGAVSGVSQVGGLVGFNLNGTVRDSQASGRVSGVGGAATGGLVGLNRGTLDNSHASGTVSGNNNVGGLAGINEGNIDNSYATQSVTALGILVGGLTGQNNGNISNSYASGAVTGAGYVGGLSGYSNNFIANSYASGAVTSAGDEVGGLVGHQGGLLLNSYASGAVSSAGNSVGGLAGFNDGTVINSFWNVTTTGQSSSAGGGIGMTTAEMANGANFTSATAANGQANPGWDFANVWTIYEGHSEPLLRAFMTPLTVGANAAVITYDGQAYSGGNGVWYSTPPDTGKLHGTLVFTGDAQGATQVGSYALTPGGLTSDQQGYLISYASGTLSIVPRPITVTADAKSKTYGNADPALTYQVTTGSLVAGDSLSGSLSRAAGENVGSYAIAAGALANANYAITAQDGTLNIAQRPITVTADAKSKTYGNADPALTYQVTTGSLVAGDSLSGSLSRAAGENVGSYAIGAGALANANYAITAQDGTLSIAQRPITVTADAKSKTYGDADPALTYQVTTGSLVAGDSLSGSLSRGAGENVGSYAIGAGALANANYAITAQDGTLSIAQRPITVTADAKSKTYGNADPALTYQVTAGNLVAGDSLSGSVSRAAGENVGSYAIGAGALANANYAITAQDGTLSIVQRPITVTADAKDKTYGNADPALTYQVTSGNLIAGDSLSGSLSRAAGENVGSYAIGAGALANANYGITAHDATLSIVQRAITVTADAKSKTYGNADPTLTYQVTTGSLVAGDSLSGSLTRAAGENVGSYAIASGALVNANYAITAQDATLSIDQRAITVTADAQNKVYGDQDPTLSYQITGGSLVAGDRLDGALQRAAGENVGRYAIDAAALANANYRITAHDGTLSVTARPITVSADSQRKRFGDADPALTYHVSAGRLIAGDSLDGALGRAAGEAVGSYAIDADALFNGNYLITTVGATLDIERRVFGDLPAPQQAAIGTALAAPAAPPIGAAPVSGGLAFVGADGAQPDGAPAAQGAAIGQGGADAKSSEADADADAAVQAGGRAASGLTRVLVVSGGIRMPSQPQGAAAAAAKAGR